MLKLGESWADVGQSVLVGSSRLACLQICSTAINLGDRNSESGSSPQTFRGRICIFQDLGRFRCTLRMELLCLPQEKRGPHQPETSAFKGRILSWKSSRVIAIGL